MSIEQNPSCEDNSHSYGQEISTPLWNKKVHYDVHNRPTLVPIELRKDKHAWKFSQPIPLRSNLISSCPAVYV
jgi:hypothetical protein